MGGGRGYGPTHSQTLDRFLIGIENVTVVALNVLVNPEKIYTSIMTENHPVIVIENKVDYGKTIGLGNIPNYTAFESSDKFPVVRISPKSSTPSLTLVTYGGMVTSVIECVKGLFREYEIMCEVIVLSRISPIDYRSINDSVQVTKRLVVIEEGSKVGGVASEVISSVIEQTRMNLETLKIGAKPVPIPSARHLEEKILPSVRSIIEEIVGRFT
jgi:2-oxoisovalerate dehydrogenase E1 component